MEFVIGVTGKDAALFIDLGVKILENDHDLDIEVEETAESILKAGLLSVSELLEGRLLKLSLGRMFLREDLGLVEEGLEDSLSRASEGLGVRTKLTRLGVGVGVGGVILNSCRDTSSVLVGISRKRFDFLHCLLLDVSDSDICNEFCS